MQGTFAMEIPRTTLEERSAAYYKLISLDNVDGHIPAPASAVLHTLVALPDDWQPSFDDLCRMRHWSAPADIENHLVTLERLGHLQRNGETWTVLGRRLGAQKRRVRTFRVGPFAVTIERTAGGVK